MESIGISSSRWTSLRKWLRKGVSFESGMYERFYLRDDSVEEYVGLVLIFTMGMYGFFP